MCLRCRLEEDSDVRALVWDAVPQVAAALIQSKNAQSYVPADQEVKGWDLTFKIEHLACTAVHIASFLAVGFEDYIKTTNAQKARADKEAQEGTLVKLTLDKDYLSAKEDATK